MAALALWSQELTPGKPFNFSPAGDIKITNVALGDTLADENGRTTVKLTYPKISPPEEDEDEDMEDDDGTPTTTFLCSLTPSKIEQATVDVVLIEDSPYVFELVGKNTVYLTGYYVDQNANQPPGDEDGFGSDMGSEDDHDLRFVSSDVEIDPEDLDDVESDASRFEEVVEDEKSEKPQSKKRVRDAASEEGKPASKAEKKNKKQKLEEKSAEEKSEKKEKEKGDKKEKGGAEKQLAGGLKIKDSKVGTGPMAKKGQTISMRYIGKLQNGKVFDQNIKGKPFKFRLGAGEVIRGWDEGIVGMQAGGERVLTVPAPMGYGKRGSGPIPPNATLIFEVKCIEIK
ncbi:hypothetical protein K435DRAFT_717168 [Dendrothele bispora CBS 962.96]|uniref:peptidylprolyl isomerase n=1 Tax=Dendrothele bispora (strain CBS 962.96) TaxID=1314807 RepID=A0A4S8MI38_DENBC|nr:hypothetical protein K435DRAFT_717168 [Dendrothele bispora CBS 962.96]